MSLESTLMVTAGKLARRSLVQPAEHVIAAIARPLTTTEKIWNQAIVRKVFILLLLAVAWQVYAQRLNNTLMFPTFKQKTAYEISRSDWSSDVCSSDLVGRICNRHPPGDGTGGACQWLTLGE